jgi:hypothetical protein
MSLSARAPRTFMTRGLTLVLLLVFLLGAASAARAQDVAGASEVRALAGCVEEHQTHLERLVRLIGEAEERLRSSDPAVAADARAAIGALVGRAHGVREHLRRCVEAARIPGGGPDARTASGTSGAGVPSAGGPVESESGAEDSGAEDSIAEDGGTVHLVEADVAVGDGVRIVRGERVDGTGEAPDAAVRTAVRGVGAALSACHDAYRGRGGRGRGELHLAFTVGAGGRARDVTIEGGAAFDAGLRTCVLRAAEPIRVEGARGTVTFAYTLRFGAE